MTIETASDWAISNGYHDIDTDTSDEFIAWREDGELSGVKAWRDGHYDDRFVAVRRYQNGEQFGEARGYGATMLLALQDL